MNAADPPEDKPAGSTTVARVAGLWDKVDQVPKAEKEQDRRVSQAIDTIIGKVCIERGWVTRDQLVDCLRQCSETPDSPSSSGSRLSDILISRGFVKSDQMDSLRKEVSKIIDSDQDYAIVRKGDAALGQVLVKNGSITKEQLVEVLSIQGHAASKGGTPPRLGEILLQKGFASFTAIEAALVSQKEKSPLQCTSCGAGYNVLDFDPKKKYLCKKCTGLLLPPQQATADIPDEVLTAAKNPKNLLGKYTVTKELGRGGMGVVYKAWDGALKRWVALKVLIGTGAKDELARFRREAQTAAALRHPAIVGIFEVTDAAEKHLIAMEFIDGRSLAGEKMPALKAAELMLLICEAVEFAHSKGIIHRDIKPHNIMVDKEGKPFVMDFGLAKSLQSHSQITMSGTVVGTPSYMAPEQAEGRLSQVDQRSDVYSLGAVLYEILTGRPPFKGNNPIETLRKVVHEEALPPTQIYPAIPKDMETIVLKCLEKDPERRYPGARALAADLRSLLSGREIRAQRAAMATRVSKKLKRHWAPFAIAGAAVVILGLVLALVASSSSGAKNEARVRELAKSAEGLFAAGDSKAALAKLDTALALAPADPDLKRRAAECRVKIKAEEDAAARKKHEEEERGLAAQKKREEARLKAQPEFDEGKSKMDRAKTTLYQAGADMARTELLFEEAIGHFARALLAFPEHHEALHLRGFCYYSRSNLAAAELDFSAAIGLLKTFSTAYYDRGRVYIDLAAEAMGQSRADGAEAESEARDCRAKAKADLGAYRQVGGKDPERLELAEALLAWSELDYAQVIRVCDRMIAAQTNNEEVYKLKGDAWILQAESRANPSTRTTSYNEALKAFSEALKRRPNYPEASLQQGVAHFRLDDEASALKSLEKAVLPNTKNARAYAGRSKVYVEMGKDAEALSDLEKAVMIAPNDPLVLTRLGGEYYYAKNYTRALEMFERAVKVDPKSANTLSLRGLALVAVGDTQRGLQDLLDAQKLNPRNIEINYRIANAYHTRKEWTKAEEYYSKYVVDAPKKEKGWYYRAFARLQLKRYQDAIDDWERCLDLDTPRKADVEKRIADAKKRLGQ